VADTGARRRKPIESEPWDELGWLATPPDFSSADSLPVHTRISRWLTELIHRGDLVAADRLPREDRFAQVLGVSRMTLRQALATLESTGMVERKTGRLGGTFIREPRIECDLTGLAGFTEQMRRANVRAGAKVQSARTVAANATAARALAIPRGSPVYEVVRVRTAGREPLAIECSCFPSDVFPDLLTHRLTGSLYALMARQYGQAPVSASEALEPVIAGEREAALLGVEISSPLMLIERTAFTRAGLPVEFARDMFRPDRIRIAVTSGFGPRPRLARPDT
jgi:GntR family transcriptional regulator